MPPPSRKCPGDSPSRCQQVTRSFPPSQYHQVCPFLYRCPRKYPPFGTKCPRKIPPSEYQVCRSPLPSTKSPHSGIHSQKMIPSPSTKCQGDVPFPGSQCPYSRINFQKIPSPNIKCLGCPLPSTKCPEDAPIPVSIPRKYPLPVPSFEKIPPFQYQAPRKCLIRITLLTPRLQKTTLQSSQKWLPRTAQEIPPPPQYQVPIKCPVRITQKKPPSHSKCLARNTCKFP